MRHGKKFNQLGRKAAHRKSMLANMGASLVKSEKKRIVTTLAKAKALRVFLEPLVTKAKTNTTHNRRTVFSYLRDKEAVTEMFGAVAQKVGDRPGGYLRILKLGPREGDAAEMALIEFVDFSEYNVDKPKKRRSRRSSSKKSTPKAAAPAAEPKVEETPAEEAPAAEAPAEETPAEESADSEGGEEKAE